MVNFKLYGSCIHILSELGTQQYFRCAITTKQQCIKAFAASNNATNFSLQDSRQRQLYFSDNRFATTNFFSDMHATLPHLFFSPPHLLDSVVTVKFIIITWILKPNTVL